MSEVCIPYRIPRAWYSKGETTGRRRHHNNSERGVINLEERNVSTKGKGPKQGPTSANVLTPILPEGQVTDI